MVGGGSGAFIGAVHRMAAALDGRFEFIAGALSSTPERSVASGRELGLAGDRAYATWREMLEAESRRGEGERVDVVSIVTPNDSHFEIARAFVHAGFHVICDKPMVTTSAQARELVEVVEASEVVLAVSYNYTGYPMVKQAAELVRTGQIGEVRKVFAEYHQGWLARDLEASGQKQASWRTDPSRAGLGGAIGDIGTHAENLLSSVTGLGIEAVCAELTAFVPGRALDDDASVLMRLSGGARAVLTASQVCIGEENNFSLRVHGTRGSVMWRQEEPNSLTLCRDDGSRQVLTRGGVGLGAAAMGATRLPSGHPEGFIEAFANIYRAVADDIEGRRAGKSPQVRYPTVHDGARGVAFVERVVESARAGGAWVAW